MKTSPLSVSILLTSLLLTVSTVSADTATFTSVGQGVSSIAGLVNGFTQTIVKAVGTLFMAGAMVAFFYGIVEYIWGAREGKPEKIAVGNNFIKWSLVALFVMFSVYGIIKFGQSFLCGANGCDNTITIPDINFRTGGASTQGLQQQGNALQNSPGLQQQGNSGTGFNPTEFNQHQNTQATAQQAYNNCISRGGNASTCQSAYQASGGQGNGTENTANSAYQICIDNGNSAATCQAAYAAYGGNGTNGNNGDGRTYGSGASTNPADCAEGSHYDGTKCADDDSSYTPIKSDPDPVEVPVDQNGDPQYDP